MTARLHVVEPSESTGLPQLVDAKRLAAVLGVSEREAYRVGGRVPHYRIGRMIRWNLAEALAALREEPR